MPRWDAAARELSGGQGVDHLVEVGGAKTLETSLHALRQGGRLVLVGQLSGDMADVNLASKNDRGVRVDQVFVGSAWHLSNLCAEVERTGLEPVIDRVFGFDEAEPAYRYLASGAHFGKVVITI